MAFSVLPGASVVALATLFNVCGASQGVTILTQCNTSQDCAGWTCYSGDSRFLLPGVCTFPCSADGGCGYANTACTTFAPDFDAGSTQICVPSCRVTSDCAAISTSYLCLPSTTAAGSPLICRRP